MNTDTLRIFKDVVRLRSFSKAATEAGVTQSAASQAVRNLEAELGVELVDRSRRPLRPTPEGKRFYDGCQEVLTRLDQLVRKTKTGAAEVQGALTVSTIYSVGLYGMRGILDRFLALHPGVQVEHRVGGGRKVAGSVESEEADLGILAFPRQTRTLEFRPLPSQQMVVACARDHRLARNADRPVSRDDLRGAWFVAYEPDLPIRKVVDRFLRTHDVRVQNRMEIDNTETIKQAVRSGAGISILPAPNLQREVRSGALVIRPFAFGELRRPIGILRRRKRRLSPAAKAFLELMKDEPQLWEM